MKPFTRGGLPKISRLTQEWRTAMILDTIHPTQKPQRWSKTPNYEQLEPTEKGFMSGLMGGVICKIVAEKIFKVKYFGHIEYFENANPGHLIKDDEPKKPDFLGLPAHGRRTSPTVIVESKGRSDQFNFSRKTIEDAKYQSTTISGVRNYRNLLNYAQFSHFKTGDGRLLVDLYDPPPPDETPKKDQVLKEIDLRFYYEETVTALQSLAAEQIDIFGIPYVCARYPTIDLVTGLPLSIFESVITGEKLHPTSTVSKYTSKLEPNLIETLANTFDFSRSDQLSANLGPDGTLALLKTVPVADRLTSKELSEQLREERSRSAFNFDD